MIRLLIAAFLVGHGLVHGIMFSLPYSAQASAGLPFNPSHSWLLGTTRSVGMAVALAVTLGFVAVGAAYLAQVSWWPAAAVAAALSVVLLALYFTRWWSVGIVISAAVAVVAWRVQQAA